MLDNDVELHRQVLKWSCIIVKRQRWQKDIFSHEYVLCRRLDHIFFPYAHKTYFHRISKIFLFHWRIHSMNNTIEKYSQRVKRNQSIHFDLSKLIPWTRFFTCNIDLRIYSNVFSYFQQLWFLRESQLLYLNIWWYTFHFRAVLIMFLHYFCNNYADTPKKKGFWQYLSWRNSWELVEFQSDMYM